MVSGKWILTGWTIHLTFVSWSLSVLRINVRISKCRNWAALLAKSLCRVIWPTKTTNNKKSVSLCRNYILNPHVAVTLFGQSYSSSTNNSNSCYCCSLSLSLSIHPLQPRVMSMDSNQAEGISQVCGVRSDKEWVSHRDQTTTLYVLGLSNGWLSLIKRRSSWGTLFKFLRGAYTRRRKEWIPLRITVDHCIGVLLVLFIITTIILRFFFFHPSFAHYWHIKLFFIPFLLHSLSGSVCLSVHSAQPQEC